MTPIQKVEHEERRASEFGFCWQTVDQLIEQIRSECVEIKEAHEKNDRAHLQEEVGDLLHAAVGLAIFCGLDPSETLNQSCDKFKKRLDAVVELVKKDGLEHLQNQPFDLLMQYWDKAKKALG